MHCIRGLREQNNELLGKVDTLTHQNMNLEKKVEDLTGKVEHLTEMLHNFILSNHAVCQQPPAPAPAPAPAPGSGLSAEVAGASATPGGNAPLGHAMDSPPPPSGGAGGVFRRSPRNACGTTVAASVGRGGGVAAPPLQLFSPSLTDVQLGTFYDTSSANANMESFYLHVMGSCKGVVPKISGTSPQGVCSTLCKSHHP